MAVHTVAYYDEQNGSKGNNVFFEIPAVKDLSVQVTSGKRVILSKDMNIIAGFAGMEPVFDPSSPPQFLVSSRVSAPSLRKVVSPHIVPTGMRLPVGGDSTLPAIMSVADWPWKVSSQEEIAIEVTRTGNTPRPILGLLWFEDRREAVPAGDNYWIRGRVNAPDGAAGDAAVGWDSASVTYEQTLAAGRYAVIGCVYKGDGTYAARLVFDDQVWRPGTLALNRGSDQIPDVFRNGSLGVLGRFESYSPPRLEVMRVRGSSSQDDAELYLRIVRLGAPGTDNSRSASYG